jgi:hypothetical protein
VAKQLATAICFKAYAGDGIHYARLARRCNENEEEFLVFFNVISQNVRRKRIAANMQSEF